MNTFSDKNPAQLSSNNTVPTYKHRFFGRKKGKVFATEQQRKSFLKKDGSNFLILGCDSSIFEPRAEPRPGHAVYVENYDVSTQTFYCINSWGPTSPNRPTNPKPKVRDDANADVFNVYGVHLKARPRFSLPHAPAGKQEKGKHMR